MNFTCFAPGRIATLRLLWPPKPGVVGSSPAAPTLRTPRNPWRRSARSRRNARGTGFSGAALLARASSGCESRPRPLLMVWVWQRGILLLYSVTFCYIAKVRRRALSADFGHYLRLARLRSGMSMSALAARSGVSLTSLSRFEGGTRQPGFADACDLARALGTPLLFLADGRDRTGSDSRDLIAHLAHWGLNDLAPGEVVLGTWRASTPRTRTAPRWPTPGTRPTSSRP